MEVGALYQAYTKAAQSRSGCHLLNTCPIFYAQLIKTILIVSYEGYDCGVFTCMFSDFISKDSPPVFTQDHIYRCCERIALAIPKIVQLFRNFEKIFVA